MIFVSAIFAYLRTDKYRFFNLAMGDWDEMDIKSPCDEYEAEISKCSVSLANLRALCNDTNDEFIFPSNSELSFELLNGISV